MDENNVERSGLIDYKFLTEAFRCFAKDLQTSGLGALETALNAKITNNTTNIGNHETRIAANETDIGNHETRITNNTTNIGNHETRITNNTTNIGNHETRIAANEGKIGSNTTRITANETNIQRIQNTISYSQRPIIPCILDSSNWEIDNSINGYSYTYTNTKIKDEYDYVFDLDFSDFSSIQDTLNIESEWNKVKDTEITEGTIKFYASELPEGNIPIKIKQLF